MPGDRSTPTRSGAAYKAEHGLPPRYAWALPALAAIVILFQLADALTWYALGQPIMFDHTVRNGTIGLAALAALIVTIFLAERIAEDNWIAFGVLAFGGFLILIQETGVVIDRRHNQPIGGGAMFVEAITMPGAGRHLSLRPIASVRGPDWEADLLAPREEIEHWVAGSTCIEIEVRRGRDLTTFVRLLRVRSAGDGTGSPAARSANRARCLRAPA